MVKLTEQKKLPLTPHNIDPLSDCRPINSDMTVGINYDITITIMIKLKDVSRGHVK